MYLNVFFSPHQDLAEKYEVSAMPTFLFFKDKHVSCWLKKQYSFYLFILYKGVICWTFLVIYNWMSSVFFKRTWFFFLSFRKSTQSLVLIEHTSRRKSVGWEHESWDRHSQPLCLKRMFMSKSLLMITWGLFHLPFLRLLSVVSNIDVINTMKI